MDVRAEFPLEDFEAFIADKKSTRTARTYKYNAKKFLDWVEANNIDLTTARRALLDDYASDLKKRELKPSSINLMCVAARQYITWLVRQDVELPDFLTPMLSSAKKNTTAAVVLSDNAVKLFLAECMNLPDPARTCLLLMYATGMRTFEAGQLKLTDVHVVELADHHRFLLQVHGKGDKLRTIPVPLEYNPVLKDYLTGWRTLYHDKHQVPWLFPGRRGGHLKPRSIRERIQQVKEELGFPVFTPHVLRKTYATHLSTHGMPVLMVTQLLGHVEDSAARFRVTSNHYINHALEALARALDDVSFPVPPEYE